MSDKMKDETIAMVAVDIAVRAAGWAQRGERWSMGELAEKAVRDVEGVCAAGQLGLLHASFLRDPETGEMHEFGSGEHRGDGEDLTIEQRMIDEIGRRNWPDEVKRASIERINLKR